MRHDWTIDTTCESQLILLPFELIGYLSGQNFIDIHGETTMWMNV